MWRFAEYATWIFDCDGVILDSNRIKTEAFRRAALSYGQQQADMLADYNRRHGGISRYAKFDYFFRVILGREPSEAEMAGVLAAFAAAVKAELSICALDSGFLKLMQALPGRRKFVVSGGAQDELRAVFRRRNIDQFFSAIFGSPDTKGEIFERELANRSMRIPAVFVGDSRLDYEAANQAGLDFVFVSHWTEFDDWQDFFSDKAVLVVPDLEALANLVEVG